MATVHYFKLKVEVPENETVFLETLAEIVEDESLVAVGEFKTHEVLYTFLEKEKVSQLENLFRIYDVLIDSKDLTEEVLSCSFQDPEFLEIFEDTTYSKLLRNFVIQNLDPNRILEKISKYGINSITKIEKKILSNY
jgi:hypothetical protein